jgi:hypothetical protein
MMRDAALLHRLAVDVGFEDVWRALGVPKEAPRRERTARRLEALLPSALALLHPRGAWRIVGHKDAVNAGMVRPPERVGIAVCTIGDALERASTERVAVGELLDGLVLDAVGSAAAEAAADTLNLHLCQSARARTLHTSARESPGYESWDVACQPRLLSLLPVARLGISLTEGGMMVPRKSVSFAVRLLGEPTEGDIDTCSRCGRRECRHRRTRRIES